MAPSAGFSYSNFTYTQTSNIEHDNTNLDLLLDGSNSDIDIVLDSRNERRDEEDGDGGGGGGDGGKARLMYYMRKAGVVLGLITFIFLLILIPILTASALHEKTHKKDHIAFYSAGAFVLLTLPISIREISCHLTNYYMPPVQKYVIRILWMVPLYSMQSWLSLRFHGGALYIESLRDLYESYVLASFLYYIIELLGGEENIKAIIRKKPLGYGSHGRILSFFIDPWEGDDFPLQCKYGVLQYVVIKILSTFITYILQIMGSYDEGSFRLDKGYLYIALVTNASQMWALYVLVKLYFAVEEDLKGPTKDWHPVGKFLCVKGIVFFTWWQGVFIALLQSWGVINSIGTWDSDDVAGGLQDYLICVEMLFFAIAHSFTFSYKEYMNLSVNGSETASYASDMFLGTTLTASLREPSGFREALRHSSVPRETIDDMRFLVKGTKHYEKRKRKEERSNREPVIESV